jgi:hypothetical protein
MTEPRIQPNLRPVFLPVDAAPPQAYSVTDLHPDQEPLTEIGAHVAPDLLKFGLTRAAVAVPLAGAGLASAGLFATGALVYGVIHTVHESVTDALDQTAASQFANRLYLDAGVPEGERLGMLSVLLAFRRNDFGDYAQAHGQDFVRGAALASELRREHPAGFDAVARQVRVFHEDSLRAFQDAAAGRFEPNQGRIYEAAHAEAEGRIRQECTSDAPPPSNASVRAMIDCNTFAAREVTREEAR